NSHGGPDSADLRTAEGVRAAKWSSLALFITGAVELGIFALGDSAGLLADAIHNLGDVTTTLAIWAAFTISRRSANERYPYGYHRVEDLAALFVLVVMTASGVAAGYESIRHVMTGAHPTRPAITASAAVVGVHDVRVRWAGRALFVSLNIDLRADMPLAEAHDAAEAVRHALMHEIVDLQGIDIHMDPSGQYEPAHADTAHHRADAGASA